MYRKSILLMLILGLFVTPSTGGQSFLNTNPKISTNTITLIEFSGNLTFVYGSTGNVMTFTAIESVLPWDYFVYDNGSLLIDSTNWNNNTQNIINLDSLNVGVHQITIRIWSAAIPLLLDAYVTVLADMQNPVLGVPSVFSMMEGTTGNLLHFNVSDNANTRYRYMVSGSGFSPWSDYANLLRYNFSLDAVSSGWYTLTLQVEDRSANLVLTDIDLAVYVPDAAGFVEVPTTTTITSGDLLTEAWRIYVPDADRVRYSVDGGVWQDYGTATNFIGYPIDFSDTSPHGNFSPGVHSVEMQVNDTSGKIFSDTHTIIINSPSTTLFVSTPAADEYRLDSKDYSLSWSAIAVTPGQYRFWVNGTTTDWTSWQSNVPFSYQGNLNGPQNITLQLTGTGGTFWDTVIVNPFTIDISVPTVLSYVYDSGGNAIFWSVSESRKSNSSHAYTWTLENSVQTGTWSHQTLKIFDIDGLSLGIYTATLNVSYFGSFIIREVEITVYDDLAPILTQPDDVSYTLGTGGHEVSWIITESFPNVYRIELDGTYSAWTPYASGESVTFNLDGLAEGAHSVSLQVIDSSDNLASDTVIILVSVDNPPDTVTDRVTETDTKTITQDNTVTVTDTVTSTTSKNEDSPSPVLGLLFLLFVPLVRSRRSSRKIPSEF